MLKAVVDYFETIPSIHRALLVAGGLAFFWMTESAIPLFKFPYNKWKHAVLNIFFTFTTIGVNFGFAFLIALTSLWCRNNEFGVLYWIKMPLGLQLPVGLMLLDLIGAYLIHLIEHKYKWLWKFHIIHHADTYVDTTTANRHHPGESVFRAVFTIIAVFLTGAPFWLIMIYQSLSALLSQFNHANISLPSWLDKGLSLVIVSPDMHKVHHHYMRPETDSNYGNIFSLWDRLFGTFRYTPSKNIRFGLDVLEERKLDGLSDQLRIPFNKNIRTD